VPIYYMNEGSFELPGVAIADRTTHVVETKHPDHDVTLVVCRSAFPAGKSVRQLARGRVLDEMTRLAGYTVLEEREALWAEVPAVELTSRWRHEGRVFYQQQAHLGLTDTWLFFAMSAPIEHRAPCDAWFEQIRSSLRIRGDA
jgi:hypothetical protein